MSFDKLIREEIEFGGRTLKLEVGRLARQANMAVLASYGETCVLATVATSKEPSSLDYFPLDVEYLEKLYAGGRIKGSRWVKREGRPSDEAVLAGRLIDRSIRPLFPKDYHYDVQVTIEVLSVDGENDPVVLAALATSAALTFSDIPWQGPIATVGVGMKDGAYFINPVASEKEFSDLDLVVSNTKEKTVMIEAKANEVKEKEMAEAIAFARQQTAALIDFIEKMRQKVGKEKIVVTKEKIEGEEEIKKAARAVIKEYFAKKDNSEDIFDFLINSLVGKFPGNKERDLRSIADEILKEEMKKRLLKGERPDGRKIDEIRPLSMEVGVLPRTHGSALFTRGMTQVLTIATLGSLSLEQWIESPEGEETKRYMHHYAMPPFASGEVGFLRGPGRREIGHGALAEKALEPVLPSESKFPYAIRLVSEVMSSNGSTSMASVCGSTLSLMDAGVPIKAPVAGIAMGLVTKGEDYVILTDIAGVEDHNGEMDFKVAGTKEGITAIQLDVKNDGLNEKIIGETLERARQARLFILEKMTAVISSPRKNISQYAPKVALVKIDPEKIGAVVGPGGKIIRQIIEETKCDVNVEDDGRVTIAGPKEEDVKRAKEWVESLVREVKVGEIFEGTVKRIQPFGAFVEILPGKEGLVHVSQMASRFVKEPSEVVAIGDKVKVKVREIDDQGRINLTMLLDGEKKEEGRKNDRDKRARSGGGARNNSGLSYSVLPTRSLISQKKDRDRFSSRGGRRSERKSSCSRFSHFSPRNNRRGR